MAATIDEFMATLTSMRRSTLCMLLASATMIITYGVSVDADVHCDFESNSNQCPIRTGGSLGIAAGKSRPSSYAPMYDKTLGTPDGHYLFLGQLPNSGTQASLLFGLMEISQPTCLSFWSCLNTTRSRYKPYVEISVQLRLALYKVTSYSNRTNTDGWFFKQLNLPYGKYTMELYFNVYGGSSLSVIAIDEIRISACSGPTAPPAPAPGTFPNCSFRNGLCGYSNINAGHYWTSYRGYARAYGDMYNAPYRTGDAHLVSPNFTVPYDMTYCLDFYYTKKGNRYNWHQANIYNVSDPSRVNYVWTDDGQDDPQSWTWAVQPLSPGPLQLLFSQFPLAEFAIKNFTIHPCPAVATAPPTPQQYSRKWSCDFENSVCGIVPGRYTKLKDNFKWAWSSNASLPDDSKLKQSRNGSFMYIKITGFALANDMAEMETPLLMSYPKLCVSFDYYMHGSGEDRLTVYMRFGLYKLEFQGDQGNMWHHQIIRISSRNAQEGLPFRVTKVGIQTMEIAIDNMVTDECRETNSPPPTASANQTTVSHKTTTIRHRTESMTEKPSACSWCIRVGCTVTSTTTKPTYTTDRSIPNTTTRWGPPSTSSDFNQEQALHQQQKSYLESEVAHLQMVLGVVTALLVVIILVLVVILVWLYVTKLRHHRNLSGVEMEGHMRF